MRKMIMGFQECWKQMCVLFVWLDIEGGGGYFFVYNNNNNNQSSNCLLVDLWE
ncbi:hypothetical protein HanRHA438_Chr13g0605061 [Helianthus annuus]|nr:hypothetical protein HanRHA438_Chr13g0605061 [Helianthus annuus]